MTILETFYLRFVGLSSRFHVVRQRKQRKRGRNDERCTNNRSSFSNLCRCRGMVANKRIRAKGMVKCFIYLLLDSWLVMALTGKALQSGKTPPASVNWTQR